MTRSMRIASSCAVALGIVLAMPSLASAQTADAEALFREGVRLLKAREVAKACEKLEGSERLEAKFSTEFNLALCRQRNGQTASAWAMFIKAADNAKRSGAPQDAKLAIDAQKHADALEPKLVHLTIRVPDNHEIDGLAVTRNETPVDPGTWNQPIPVDPGDYVIAAEAPDHKRWSESITIDAKDETIEVPKLARHKPAAPPPEPTAEPSRPTSRPPPTPPTPKHPAEPTRRYTTAAVTLAAVGVVSVGVATGFGLYSSNLETQSDAICPMVSCAKATALDLNSRAQTAGWIANVGWSVGGLAIAGAATAWWLGRPSRDVAVSLVPIVGGDRAGLALGGRF